MKIAIVGGGVSGLTTGFWIKKLRPNTDITIIEKEAILGGKLQTKNLAGFNIEIGGNGFLDSKPDMLELVSAIGANDMLLKSNEASSKRFIYHKNKLYELPFSAKAFFKTKLLSFGSKLRVATEFLIPAKRSGNENESVKDFGYRRVGKSFTDIFLDAMTAGIFASSPEKLSLSAAFPAVAKLEAEYGSLLKGMRAKKRSNKNASAGPSGTLTSFRDGMGSFVDKLASSYECDIKLNTTVNEIIKNNNGWIVKTENENLDFDLVILASPAFEVSRIVKSLDLHLSDLLKQIEYSPVAVVALGYDNLPEKLDGFGLLTTSNSNTQVLGILWDSSIFENRASGEKQLVRVMIGGQRQPTLAIKDEESLIQIAIGGMLQTMKQGGEPMLSTAYRWHKAIPNYSIGHEKLIESIMNSANCHKNLYLGGNAYYGVGMNECAKYSKELAQEICNKISL